MNRPFAEGSEFKAKPCANQRLVQTDGFALDGADADMPFAEAGIGAQILATDLAAADQAGQLIARRNAAGPGIGVFVDADLVELRRINAVEPVGHLGELKGAVRP